METTLIKSVSIISKYPEESIPGDYYLWFGDVTDYLAALPSQVIFDLIVTSPPYNIGKVYEEKTELFKYIDWQHSVIEELILRINDRRIQSV